MSSPARPPPLAAAIALGYGALALAWIFASDRVVMWVTGISPTATALQSGKGAVFVLVTALGLYVTLSWAFRVIRERESHFGLFDEGAPDVLFRYRILPERRQEYISPSVEGVMGYPPEAYYDDPALALSTIHPEDRPLVESPEWLTDRRSDPVLLRVVRKDGKAIWTEQRTIPVLGPRGEVVGIEGLFRDVTDRIETERSRTRLSTAIEQAGEAVIMTDRDGTIEYVNPAFERITGYAREEVLGRNPRILRSGEQRPDFYRRMWKTLLAGEAFSGRMVNRRKDGSLYDQELMITPVSEAPGEVSSFIAVARDVTPEKELERRLRHAQRMESMGRMAGGVAHDFRNLLSVIQVNSELARSDLAEGDREGVASHLLEVERATERGSEVAHKLLSLGRKEEMKRRLLDLGGLLRELLPSFRTLLREDVRIHTELDEPSPIVSGDAGSLEQILMNLVTNARDALPEGGEVTLSISRLRGTELDEAVVPDGEPADGYLVVTVRDSGVGMDAETLGRVFEPFFTTKAPGAGTGLGMMMVYNLVKLHDGFVLVDSEPGRGTTVRVHLPEAPSHDPAGSSGDPAPHDEVPGGLSEPGTPEGRGRASSEELAGTERILVVEDETALRKAAVRVLVRFGYRVRGASDGEEALQLLAEEDAELVISDLIMPKMGGAELVATLRSRGFPGRLLVMSGYGRDASPGRSGAESLDVPFLEKPWSVEVLARTVRQVLDAPARVASGGGEGSAASPGTPVPEKG